jgi:hypothetical protein
VINRRVEVEVSATLVQELQDPPQKRQSPPAESAPEKPQVAPEAEKSSSHGGH